MLSPAPTFGGIGAVGRSVPAPVVGDHRWVQTTNVEPVRESAGEGNHQTHYWALRQQARHLLVPSVGNRRWV